MNCKPNGGRDDHGHRDPSDLPQVRLGQRLCEEGRRGLLSQVWGHRRGRGRGAVVVVGVMRENIPIDPVSLVAVAFLCALVVVVVVVAGWAIGPGVPPQPARVDGALTW